MATTKLSVAVLDDYQGIAESIFAPLSNEGCDITIFRDTLLPYNHVATPESEKDALVARLEGFDVICTMRERTPFPAELIARLPKLRLLLTTGFRNRSIDMAACAARSIPVAGAGAGLHHTKVGADSTTEHTITLILALARNVAADDRAVKTGNWQTGFAMPMLGTTLGVVGLGRLGVSVARIMKVAFNVRVIAWSPNLTQEAADQKAKGEGFAVEDEDGEKTFKVVSREELFASADVVSIHMVLSERTKGLINGADLGRMKKSALLVNTSRGPLIEEKDLVDVLEKGGIRGVALDVFEIEPLPAKSPWRSEKWGTEGRGQVLVTPHMGYVGEEMLSSWYAQQVENIRRWKEGKELLTKLEE